MWENLTSVLEEMLAAYEELLTVSRKKREVLVNVKVQELEEIIKYEENIIMHVGKLEAGRQKILQEIAQASNLAIDGLTLNDLVIAADAEVSKKLEILHERLNEVLSDIKEMNALNTKLIEHSLNIVNYNINVLTQTAANPVYAAGGKQTADRMRGIFDKKV